MTKWRRGYRRTLAAWLANEKGREGADDFEVDELVLREAQLIKARAHLARNDEASDDQVASEFKLAREDIYALRIDLDRTGELEVVDCGGF